MSPTSSALVYRQPFFFVRRTAQPRPPSLLSSPVADSDGQNPRAAVALADFTYYTHAFSNFTSLFFVSAQNLLSQM